MSKLPGRFLVLDGTEGAGKTTQIRGLQKWLQDQGQTVVVTREPGGTPLAEEIRDLFKAIRDEVVDPVTESMLLWAARRQHIVQLIQPALARGDWVICDRFLPSTFAYQVHARELSYNDVIAPYLAPVMGNLWPDKTFILDVPPAVSRERLAQRGEALDRLERENAAFFERVHAGYLAYVDYDPTAVRVDATREPKAVAASIRELVACWLEKGAEREAGAVATY